MQARVATLVARITMRARCVLSAACCTLRVACSLHAACCCNLHTPCLAQLVESSLQLVRVVARLRRHAPHSHHELGNRDNARIGIAASPDPSHNGRRQAAAAAVL